MRPIPTRYAGCHFRSRLEARWAVFLDRLEVDWQYEPEGFDLGRHGWYLPDFRITTEEGTGYLEVKPLVHGAHPELVLSDAERRKIIGLSEQPGIHVAVVGEHGRVRPADGVLSWRWADGEWAPGLVTFGRDTPRLIAAWSAARSARFEFGQEGA